MVISGRTPGGRVFEKVLDAVREVRARHDLRICACLGLLSAEQATALKDAGVTQVNHNLNTSARYTPQVVSTGRGNQTGDSSAASVSDDMRAHVQDARPLH